MLLRCVDVSIIEMLHTSRDNAKWCLSRFAFK